MLRTTPLSQPQLFGDFTEPWRELIRGSADATPFQTPEWQSIWSKHYGLNKQPTGLAIYEGDDLVGLATFVVSTAGWRTVRWLGGGPSDYLQPLSRAGYEERIAQEVADFLKSFKDVDLVDLHQVRENQPLSELLDTRIKLEQATSLVLDLPKTFDEYLKVIGKSLRYDVRKLDKDLFKSGKATMETVSSADIGTGFELFLEQHKARWRERKLPGAFVGKSLRFHREWIQAGVVAGMVKLKILRVDGVPAGAIYSMGLNGVTYYYQAGFNPNFKSISPGTLLVAECIREGIEEGMNRFDFMRGDEPYKRRWKPQHVFRNLRLLDTNRQARGNAGFAWNLKAHELEMKIRSKLEAGGVP